MRLADRRWLPRRQPKPPSPRPTFTPMPDMRPPRPRQVRQQGHAPTTAQPILRPAAPPGPRRYQPPPLHVLRRVARALRESQSRQQRFWHDFDDLPIFHEATKGHVWNLYTEPRITPLAAEGSLAQWAEQARMAIQLQTNAARTEAAMNLAAIERRALAALQPPSQPPTHPPRMGHSPWAGGEPTHPPRTGQTSVRGVPQQPIRGVPEKIFRDRYR